MPRNWTPQQPAIAFEQKHGLSGIAGHYKFPDEAGMDRLSMQHMVWDQYDALSREDAIAKRLKQFGEAIKNPAITPQEITANENLAGAFGKFIKQREHEELSLMLGKLEALNPQIAHIRFDRTNTTHLSDVVHGMVSGFHPDCIDHYINRENGVSCLMEL